MSYLVILPTLNEKGPVVKLIENIKSIFSEIQQEYEIIIADNNSTDGSTDLVRNLCKTRSKEKFSQFYSLPLH